MTRKEKTQLWASRISDYRASGERMTVWCERHQIPVRQMRYWLRRLEQAKQPTPAEGKPQWISLLPEAKAEVAAPILLRIGGATIEVRPGFEPTLLGDVIRTLKALC